MRRKNISIQELKSHAISNGLVGYNEGYDTDSKTLELIGSEAIQDDTEKINTSWVTSGSWST